MVVYCGYYVVLILMCRLRARDRVGFMLKWYATGDNQRRILKRWCETQLAFCPPSRRSTIFTARRYASASTGCGPGSITLPVSVCHKSVFYRQWWADRAGFWHRGFLRPVLRCVVTCKEYKHKGTSIWNFVLNSDLENWDYSD